MRGWIRGIAAVVAIALLLFMGWRLVRGVGGLLGSADFSASERDPMFAEEAERPERPPELDEEAAPPDHPTLDDYVPEVESPVDVTVDELIRRAKAAEGNT